MIGASAEEAQWLSVHLVLFERNNFFEHAMRLDKQSLEKISSIQLVFLQILKIPSICDFDLLKFLIFFL